jgi:hypothetical protein
MHRFLALGAVAALALALSAPVASAAPDEHQLRGDGTITFVAPTACPDLAAIVGASNVPPGTNLAFGCWHGTLSGDLAATISFWETPNRLMGSNDDKVMQFFEVLLIQPQAGGWMLGTDKGIWNFATFKFRAEGWITDASAGLTDFVGYRYFEMGTTTDPSGPVLQATDVEWWMTKAQAD